jgi:hypothetical protein
MASGLYRLEGGTVRRIPFLPNFVFPMVNVVRRALSSEYRNWVNRKLEP